MVFIQDPQSFDHSEFFVRALACPSYPLNEITKKTWGLEVNVYLPRVQAIIKFTGKALQHQHLKMQLM